MFRSFHVFSSRLIYGFSNDCHANVEISFQNVSVIITGIGIVTFALFQAFFKLKDPKEQKANGHSLTNGTPAPTNGGEAGEPIKFAKSKIMHFLQMPLLYQTSLL